MKIPAVTRVALLCIFTIFNLPVHAAYPSSSPSSSSALSTLTSATGTATATSGSGSLCSGSPTTSFSIAFFNFNDSSLSWDVTATLEDGSSLSGTAAIVGVDMQIQVSGINADGNNEMDYLLTGSSLNGLSFEQGGRDFYFTFSSDESDGMGNFCFLSGNGMISFVAGEVLNPETTTPSTILNNTSTLNQVVNTMVTTLNTRIQNAFRGRAGFKRVANGVMYDTGMNAGDGSSTVAGVWGSYSRSTFENDFVRTRYDGDRNMFMGGIDYAPTDNVIVGMSITYEDADVDTAFNNGSASSDGYTLAPYVGIVLNDTWNIDISGGLSSINTNQNRAGGTITSNVDTDRFFASFNLNGYKQIDRWFLTGRIGAVYAESEDDDFIESNGTPVAERQSRLGQFQLGGEAAYELGAWEPYVGGAYRYDMTSTETVLTAGEQPDNDHSDFLLSAGLRFYSKEGLTMSFGYDKLYGREDYDEDTFSFSARWDF